MRRLASIVGCVSALTITGILSPQSADASGEPYLADIMVVANTFCPRGWTEADGKLMSIAQNQSLYSLLGTRFGGDGRTTFGVPDLRGRAPTGIGTGTGLSEVTDGQKGGSDTVTLTTQQMAAHSHSEAAHTHLNSPHTHAAAMQTHSGGGDTHTPVNSSFGTYPTGTNAYAAGPLTGAANGGDMHEGVVRVNPAAASETDGVYYNGSGLTGEGKPIGTHAPFIVMRYCMATQGVFPARN